MGIFSTIPQATADLAAGKMVLVVDDKTRENEGDLIMAGEFVSAADISFMAKKASGLICTPVSAEIARRLSLDPMVSHPREVKGCNFTVTVDAAAGISTGISAEDRAITIRKIADSTTASSDFVRPGHVFPLVAKSGGVLVRAGHTEATCDLLRMAGLKSVGVICEVMNEDGSMARQPELAAFSEQYGISMIDIQDLIEYRRSHELLIEKKAEADLPTLHGDFRIHIYQDVIDGREHVALVRGDVKKNRRVLVRLHSECMTGDVFTSMRCDCGAQLERAMELIVREDAGVILYLRHEGRGIGLVNKVKSYALQDQGYDTVEANTMLGFADDLRDYSVGSQILKDLGVMNIQLLTNNPRKSDGLSRYGIHVESLIPLEVIPNERNRHYLQTKKEKLGHTLKQV